MKALDRVETSEKTNSCFWLVWLPDHISKLTLHLQASQADLHRQVHGIYMHSSLIICMHTCICLAHKHPEALSHCDHGHDLTSVASVVNIADLRNAFIKTLASERFCQNAIDDTTRRSREARQRGFTASIYIHTYTHYIYEHEAIQKRISENNIGAPKNIQTVHNYKQINKIIPLH